MYHGVTQMTSDKKRAPERDEASGPPSGEGGGKKERVLHTRVPAVLERELKRFADNLRVPVSNLVRAILQDAVQVADAAGTGIEERLKSAAKTLETERERLKKKVHPDPLADAVAFQGVTLAQPAVCVKCGDALPRGAAAHVVVHDGPGRGPTAIVCRHCLPT
jgi:hypothetical protein